MLILCLVFPNIYIKPVQAFVKDFQSNEPVKVISLHPRVFDASPRADVVHRVVVWHRACIRKGTHCTKNKAEKRGSGRKIRATGQDKSRIGQIRASLRRGGKSHI